MISFLEDVEQIILSTSREGLAVLTSNHVDGKNICRIIKFRIIYVLAFCFVITIFKAFPVVALLLTKEYQFHITWSFQEDNERRL